MAFSPDGARLASSSHQDRLTRVWDIASGRELSRLPHGDVVFSVMFSPDGTMLATGCANKLARVWKVA